MNRTDTQKTPKELSRADLKKRKARLHRIVGAGIRLVFFAAMPSAFATGFSGVKYLMTSIGKGEALTMNSFVWTLIGLLIFTFVFGRFFCGYVCAFGTLGDAVYSVSAWIQKKVFHRKKPLTIPQRAQRPLQKVKYLVLAVLVLICAFGSYSLLTGWSPWDVFSRLTAFQSPAAGYIGGAVLLAVIVIGMAFQPRFFCQFLCPMGALFSLMPILRSVSKDVRTVGKTVLWASSRERTNFRTANVLPAKNVCMPAPKKTLAVRCKRSYASIGCL